MTLINLFFWVCVYAYVFPDFQIFLGWCKNQIEFAIFKGRKWL